MKNTWTKNNQIELLEGGAEYFSRLIQEIDRAKTEVILISYIFKPDQVGRSFMNALKRATSRGVRTSVILDGVGSVDLSYDDVKSMRDSGIEIHIFRPFAKIFHLRAVFWRRLHQKMLIVDETIAVVGGINIDGEQLSQLDYAVLVQGPLSLRIHKVTKMFLCRLRNDWVEYFLTRRRRLRSYERKLGSTLAAFVIRDNLRHRRQIEQIYLKAIQDARSEILIANAYFFPGLKFRRALRDASRRSVRVRLLLQGRTDHPIVRNASWLLFHDLLAAGVEITEYHHQMLHAKVAVIDGHWLTVGSCNLDLFSLFLSLEANVVMDDQSLAAELRSKLDLAMREGGISITLDSLPQRNPFKWFLSWVSLIVLRIIRFLSGE